ncbi:UNVERIFIED_CONTAM: hypothetical protein PYX00_001950 [Menopon gallinae]|uniref:Ribosomal protein S14 n=1 Tax=Menopon gallinae TaxID=328185 RepID=A0AAW2I6T5_9NEOP
MWLYRRMLKIPWTRHMTNAEVLARMDKERELLYEVKRRKLHYFGHTLRNAKYKLLQRRTSWLKNLREWFGLTSTALFRAAASKVAIAMLIANLRRGDGS